MGISVFFLLFLALMFCLQFFEGLLGFYRPLFFRDFLMLGLTSIVTTVVAG